MQFAGAIKVPIRLLEVSKESGDTDFLGVKGDGRAWVIQD